MRYLLIRADGTSASSVVPGRLGGNRKSKIYGRLDCPSAICALARGYAKRRVFFADEATAIAAGYRPCAVCMREEYARWRRTQGDRRASSRSSRRPGSSGASSSSSRAAGRGVRHVDSAIARST